MVKRHSKGINLSEEKGCLNAEGSQIWSLYSSPCLILALTLYVNWLSWFCTLLTEIFPWVSWLQCFFLETPWLYKEIGIFVVVHQRDCNCIFFLLKEDFLKLWLWFWKVVQNGDICNGHSNLERIQDKTQTETNGHVYNGTAVMNASSQSNTHVRQRQTGKENQESASDGQDSCKSSVTEEHVQVRLLI